MPFPFVYVECTRTGEKRKDSRLIWRIRAGIPGHLRPTAQPTLAPLAEAERLRRIARRAAANMHVIYNLLWWGIPVTSALIGVVAACTGNTKIDATTPTWLVLLAGTVAVMTVLNKAVTPEQMFEKHEWFENRFVAFINLYKIDRQIIANSHESDCQRTRELLVFERTKVLELKRIKDEWTFYPKPPPAQGHPAPLDRDGSDPD